MKVQWFAPAAAIAWLNLTGLRTLATQWSAPNSAAGSAWSTVLNTGIRGTCGARAANSVLSSARIGSIIAVWEATSMFTLRAKTFRSRAAAITASTASVGPATTVCRGDEYTVTVTPG